MVRGQEHESSAGISIQLTSKLKKQIKLQSSIIISGPEFQSTVVQTWFPITSEKQQISSVALAICL